MQTVISDGIFGGSMTHRSRIPVPLSPPLPPQKTQWPGTSWPGATFATSVVVASPLYIFTVLGGPS
jgi:hypothetical protein